MGTANEGQPKKLREGDKVPKMKLKQFVKAQEKLRDSDEHKKLHRGGK